MMMPTDYTHWYLSYLAVEAQDAALFDWATCQAPCSLSAASFDSPDSATWQHGMFNPGEASYTWPSDTPDLHYPLRAGGSPQNTIHSVPPSPTLAFDTPDPYAAGLPSLANAWPSISRAVNPDGHHVSSNGVNHAQVLLAGHPCRLSEQPQAYVGKVCAHCKIDTTPLWRRDPTTGDPLCNACGIYVHQRACPRPSALIAASGSASDAHSAEPLPTSNVSASEGASTSRVCSHCGTTHTSVWRRSHDGRRALLCNACGVYARTKGVQRPVEWKQRGVRPRMRYSPGGAKRDG